MTTVTADLDVTSIVAELAERKRVARLIAAGSIAFSLVIAIVASILAVAA
jgi:hypothetical protein